VPTYQTGMQAFRARILDLHGTLLLDDVEGLLEMLTDKNGFTSWWFRFELPDKKLPIPKGTNCMLLLENGRKGKCYVSAISSDFFTTLRGAGELK
jgi:hypothetical protein